MEVKVCERPNATAVFACFLLQVTVRSGAEDHGASQRNMPGEGEL